MDYWQYNCKPLDIFNAHEKKYEIEMRQVDNGGWFEFNGLLSTEGDYEYRIRPRKEEQTPAEAFLAKWKGKKICEKHWANDEWFEPSRVRGEYVEGWSSAGLLMYRGDALERDWHLYEEPPVVKRVFLGQSNWEVSVEHNGIKRWSFYSPSKNCGFKNPRLCLTLDNADFSLSMGGQNYEGRVVDSEKEPQPATELEDSICDNCDEYALQIRELKAEVERLHKRWYDLRREVDSCPDFAVVGEVMDQLELGKAQKEGNDD